MTASRVKAMLGGIAMCGLLLGTFVTTANPAYAAKKPPVPTITAVKPASGKVGAKVTIDGTNLSGATKVTFSKGKAATIITDTATKITTKVPTGAKTGTISVTTAGGTATSSSAFKVTK